MSDKRSQNEELCTKVYATFDKSVEEVEEEIKKMQDWLKTQSHLPEIMDYARIRNFLLLNKFDLEKTRNKIDMYYTIRSLVDFFDDSNPKLPHMVESLTKMGFLPSPVLFQDLYRFFYLKTTASGIYCPVVVTKAFFNTFEICLAEDLMVGQILIADVGNWNFQDYAVCTPSIIQMYWAIYEKVFSVRMKAGYFINAPPAISKIMTGFKAVLKPKIFDRIKVCPDSSVLKEDYPDECILADYGGKAPSHAELTKAAQAKFAEYQDRFDLLDKMRVDESLRVEKKDFSRILGVQGRFKNMGLD